jgi:oleate hydratase
MTKGGRMATFVGGGIGSLAGAAFLIRDAGWDGVNITILETLPLPGGSLDAAGDAVHGYTMRGGRMLTSDNYECLWGLFKTIPSLSDPDRTVFDETMAFNECHKSAAASRLVNAERAKVPVRSMGFSMSDRLELLKLNNADEAVLCAPGTSRITDWLSPSFFSTPFWLMWSTTFAFQPWNSAVEFKRYMHRFIMEFSRIETLAGVKRTVYNQYDSLVRPLLQWLEARGVQFEFGCTVTAIDHAPVDGRERVTGLRCKRASGETTLTVGEGDLVFLQNGSMTDGSTLGTLERPPARLPRGQSPGFKLWEQLAAGRPELGRPQVFNQNIAESAWQSFTVTLPTPAFLAAMEAFSGRPAGIDGLVTFSDSAWRMSIVVPHQPHFLGQPEGVQVFWGYGLFPDRIGDFVPKPMDLCGGAELLRELCGHLRFDPELVAGANCIPCRMPYIVSMFAPRNQTDRPLPVPEGWGNLGLISQFVEIPDDVVFTVEYSVRAAQLAVYGLLGLKLPVPPVTPHDKSLRVQAEAVIKAFT